MQLLCSQLFVVASHAALLWNFEARVFSSCRLRLRLSNPGERSYFRPFFRSALSCVPWRDCDLAGPRFPSLFSSLKELFLPAAVKVARWALDRLCSAVGLPLGAPA